MDQVDPRVSEMKINARGQIFYLESIIKVMNSDCTDQSILSPTVFHSNIYAPNWILGNQTINDVVGNYI